MWSKLPSLLGFGKLESLPNSLQSAILLMSTFIERITVLCFAASYAVAFALELWHLFRPRPILRFISLGFGIAGLFAHTVYLAVQQPPIGSPTGSLFFL